MAPKRFLLLTLDAAGNWPPERELVRALAERGHDVRVVANENLAEDVDAAGGGYRPYRHARPHRLIERPPDPGVTERERVAREVFLNPAYGDELDAQLTEGDRDVVLVDQMLFGAALAAESAKVPYAILCHTVYGARRAPDAVPTTADVFLGGANAMRRERGLDDVTDIPDLFERADAVLVMTYERFDRADPYRPGHVHYVGAPACVPRPVPDHVLPWDSSDERPLVLISYSTSFQDQVATLQRVADAVADLPIRALMTLGHAVTADELTLPDNIAAERFVPHAAVLPQTDLVVTHAGHGTVMAAVTAGVPTVCTPMGRDQFMVAGRVEALGLGVVVPMDSPAPEISEAIASALADTALAGRCAAFAESLDPGAGLEHAVRVLEQLG